MGLAEDLKALQELREKASLGSRLHVCMGCDHQEAIRASRPRSPRADASR